MHKHTKSCQEKKNKKKQDSELEYSSDGGELLVLYFFRFNNPVKCFSFLFFSVFGESRIEEIVEEK